MSANDICIHDKLVEIMVIIFNKLQETLDNLIYNFKAKFGEIKRKYNVLYSKHHIIIENSNILQLHCKKIDDLIIIGDTILDDIRNEEILLEKRAEDILFTLLKNMKLYGAIK